MFVLDSHRIENFPAISNLVFRSISSGIRGKRKCDVETRTKFCFVHSPERLFGRVEVIRHSVLCLPVCFIDTTDSRGKRCKRNRYRLVTLIAGRKTFDIEEFN